jgi:hypothetical protein
MESVGKLGWNLTNQRMSVKKGTICGCLPFSRDLGDAGSRIRPLCHGATVTAKLQGSGEMPRELIDDHALGDCADDLLDYLTILEEQKGWNTADAVLHCGGRI